MKYIIIIYLAILLITTIWGLVSGISVYRNPSGHEKFPWYYEIYAGLMVGALSPILIPIGIFISIGGLFEYIKNKRKNEKVQGENN